jgi:hypothetical protein
VRYAAEVVDPTTGLVRADRRFSTHRDTVRTTSNCYANAMVALLDGALRETGWFRARSLSARSTVLGAFWQGDRFVETADRSTVTGDATVFPFWLAVVAPELGLP